MIQQILDFAHGLAWEAGKVTDRYFRTGLDIETKADKSPVTVADRETERMMRDAIQSRFPDHLIVGEEFGSSGPSDSDWRWYLDPIDGTKSFIYGSPLYGVMIGVLYRNQPVIGVINAPQTGEIIYAADGLGCFLNGRRVRVSDCKRLDEAMVLATYAHGYEAYGKAEPFNEILERCLHFRTWGDCYGYLMVASGRADVMLDPILNPWDAAPLLPILGEAGGFFSDWKGQTIFDGGDGLAANQHLREELLAITAKAS
ncbi:MAG: inositol monophosphatase family protein [Myxococcales bacterium]|nr:inositol monophosphatase family protein [Myxococcales bacterium]